MPSVLVTGGAGFIGSHLAEALLRRGDDVVVVDEVNDYYDVSVKRENLNVVYDAAQEHNRKLAFYKADISDQAAMDRIFEKEKPDLIVHLAARAGVRPSIKDPELYVRANITGTLVMFEMAKKYGIKNTVYASSSSVYGKNAKVPFAESDRTDDPVSPYAATKKACELLASTYSHLYNLNLSGLRFFTVYGPRGRPDMAPYMFVDRIARGIPIDKFGDGTSCRDYTFIDDIVSGILAALDNPRPCEVYNLGNNRVVSLNEFIAVIENTVGRKAIINQKPDQPGDVPITYADLAKSQAMLGYDPKHTIEEGMSKFVHWYFTRNDPRNMLGQISPPPSPAMVGAEEEDADFSDFSEEAADDDSSISSGASEDDGSVVSELVKGRFDARSTISSSSYGTLIARTPPPPAVASKFDITLTEDKLDFNPDDATDCGCGPTDSVDALEFSKLHLNTCNRAAVTVLEGSR